MNQIKLLILLVGLVATSLGHAWLYRCVHMEQEVGQDPRFVQYSQTNTTCPPPPMHSHSSWKSSGSKAKNGNKLEAKPSDPSTKQVISEPECIIRRILNNV
jgi:hypothetical protein